MNKGAFTYKPKLIFKRSLAAHTVHPGLQLDHNIVMYTYISLTRRKTPSPRKAGRKPENRQGFSRPSLGQQPVSDNLKLQFIPRSGIKIIYLSPMMTINPFTQ